jgi:hypothetical protein
MQARLSRPLLFLALVAPALLPFHFVYHFGVNVPFWDQWDFVPTLVSFQQGHLSLDALTAQHNEHRLFFPRLIMLGLAALTRWDVRAEMYFNAVLLVALYAVLLHAHVRTFGASNRSLLAFLPVPWWVFTFRQFENLIWGWQFQITLCVLCCVISLRLLEPVRDLGARQAGAIAAAFVGTFSFGSGIAIWPIGLVMLLWQGRREGRIPWRAVAGWGLAAVLVLALYAWDFHRPAQHPSPLLFLNAPGSSLLFLLITLGAPASDFFPTCVAFGALLLAAFGVLLLEVRRGRMEPGPLSLALGMLLFAGAVAFLVLVGRSGFGREFAVTSRYTTLTLLGFVGLHRAVLMLQDPLRRGLLLGMLLSATVATGVWSFTSGLSAGSTLRSTFQRQRELLRTIDTRTDAELETLFNNTSLLRERAAELRRLQLGPFAAPAQP